MIICDSGSASLENGNFNSIRPFFRAVILTGNKGTDVPNNINIGSILLKVISGSVSQHAQYQDQETIAAK